MPPSPIDSDFLEDIVPNAAAYSLRKALKADPYFAGQQPVQIVNRIRALSGKDNYPLARGYLQGEEIPLSRVIQEIKGQVAGVGAKAHPMTEQVTPRARAPRPSSHVRQFLLNTVRGQIICSALGGLLVTALGFGFNSDQFKTFVDDFLHPPITVESGGKPEAPAKKPLPSFAPILFPLSSSIIESRYYPRLDSLAALLRDNPTWKLEVDGFADPSPDPDVERWKVFNFSLSAERAQNVKDMLVEKGVSPVKIRAKGEGIDLEAKPDQRDTWAEARRVEFYFVYELPVSQPQEESGP